MEETLADDAVVQEEIQDADLNAADEIVALQEEAKTNADLNAAESPGLQEDQTQSADADSTQAVKEQTENLQADEAQGADSASAAQAIAPEEEVDDIVFLQESEALTVGETKIVNNQYSAQFTFTPDETAIYFLEGFSTSGCSITSASLRDENDSWLASYDEWNWDGSDLSLKYSLAKGRTYTYSFYTESYDEDYSYSFQLAKTEIPTLSTHETTYIDTYSDGKWASFTVSETCGYMINTGYLDEYHWDQGFVLYDSDLYKLASNKESWIEDDNGNELIRKEIVRQLEKGKTYYLSFWGNDGSDFRSNISFEKIELATVTFHVNNDKAWFEGNQKETLDDYEHLDMESKIFAEGARIDHINNYYDYIYREADTHISFRGWSTDPNATEPDQELIASDGLELYAVWQQQHQVTFHLNNNKAYFEKWNDETEENDKISEITQWITEGTELYWHSEDDAQAYEELEYYTEDSNIFLKGWSETPNATTLNKSVYVTGDMDVWAVWGQMHKVTYDTNRDDVFYISYQWDPENEEDIEIKVKTMESSSPEGATISKWWYSDFQYDDSKLRFLGWSTNKNATEADGEIKVGDRDMTLYGVWKEIYTVTFDANGGYFYYDDYEDEYVTSRTNSFTSGETFDPYTVSTDEVKKTFTGWFDAKTGGTQYTSATKITKSVTLYAHWTNAKESNITASALTVASADNSKLIYDFTPAEDGMYVFNTADGREFNPHVTVYDKDMNEVDPVFNMQTNYNNYARITELKKGNIYYFVITNAKNGAFSYNVKIEKVPSATVTFDPNRAGATVNGTATVTMQKAKGYTIYPDNQGLHVSDVGNYKLVGWSKDKNATEGTLTLSITKDTTLYGVWKEYTTVTFDANGGKFWDDDDEDEPPLSSISSTYIVGRTIGSWSADTPSAPEGGYNFAGWATTKDATKAENEITVTPGLTVYAVWTKNDAPIPTFADAIDLELDKESTVTSKGGGVYYRFTPAETGIYEIYSYEADGDPLVELYDEDGDWLAEDDDDNDENFDLSYTLEKGRTYYYLARQYNNSSSDAFTYKMKLVKPVSTDVTFNVNCNDNLASFDGAKEEKSECVVGKRLTAYPTPDYESSKIIFVGWSADPKATEADDNIIVAKDMTLYAVWKKTVTVTFDVNTSLEEAYFLVWDNDLDEEIRSTTDSRMFAEGVEIRGYNYQPNYNYGMKDFAGWSTKKNATEADDTIIAKDGQTFYAVWKERVVITFDANGGYFSNAGVLNVNTQVKGNTLEGYENPANLDETLVFAGWATTKAAKEANVIVGETKLNADMTLYAVWKKGVKVTIHANGGYFITEDGKQDAYTAYVLPETMIRNIPYLRAQHSNDHKYDAGGRAVTASGTTLDSTTKITKATDLYVLWIDRVKVTYDANGGTVYGGATDEVWWDKGAEATISTRIQAIPADANKAFAGWSTTKNGSNLVTTLKPTADTTLYAVYKEGYQVTIASANSQLGYGYAYANGRRIQSYDNNPTFLWAKGAKASLMNLDTFLHGDQEYIGLGFSTTKDEKGLINASWTPTKDTTLYAIFVPGYHVSMNAYPGYYSVVNYDGIDSSRTYYIRKGNAIGTITEPINPAGLQMIGWYDAEDKNETLYSTAEVAKIVPKKNMIFLAKSVDPSTLKKLSASMITVKKATYTGKALKPAVTVKDGTKTLVAGIDYTVSYSNNTKASAKAVVTVTGKGNYTGTIKKNFTIAKAKQPMTVKAKAVTLKAAKVKKSNQKLKVAKTLTVGKAQGKKTYTLKGVTKSKFKKYFAVNKTTGLLTVKKGLKKGTYKVKIAVAAAGTANYLKGTKTVTVTVKVK